MNINYIFSIIVSIFKNKEEFFLYKDSANFYSLYDKIIEILYTYYKIEKAYNSQMTNKEKLYNLLCYILTIDALEEKNLYSLLIFNGCKSLFLLSYNKFTFTRKKNFSIADGQFYFQKFIETKSDASQDRFKYITLAIKYESNSFYLFSYAYLLYKTNKFSEALFYINKAILMDNVILYKYLKCLIISNIISADLGGFVSDQPNIANDIVINYTNNDEFSLRYDNGNTLNLKREFCQIIRENEFYTYLHRNNYENYRLLLRKYFSYINKDFIEEAKTFLLLLKSSSDENNFFRAICFIILKNNEKATEYINKLLSCSMNSKIKYLLYTIKRVNNYPFPYNNSRHFDEFLYIKDLISPFSTKIPKISNLTSNDLFNAMIFFEVYLTKNISDISELLLEKIVKNSNTVNFTLFFLKPGLGLNGKLKILENSIEKVLNKFKSKEMNKFCKDFTFKCLLTFDELREYNQTQKQPLLSHLLEIQKLTTNLKLKNIIEMLAN